MSEGRTGSDTPQSESWLPAYCRNLYTGFAGQAYRVSGADRCDCGCWFGDMADRAACQTNGDAVLAHNRRCHYSGLLVSVGALSRVSDD